MLLFVEICQCARAIKVMHEFKATPLQVRFPRFNFNLCLCKMIVLGA